MLRGKCFAGLSGCQILVVVFFQCFDCLLVVDWRVKRFDLFLQLRNEIGGSSVCGPRNIVDRFIEPILIIFPEYGV